MATARVLSMLDCGVCKGTFKVPVSLNCQHTFCKGCLRPLAKEKDISCPICRATHPLPKGINGLQEHPVLRQLVELQTKKTKCPLCNDVCVPDTCDHCNRLLCHACLDNHNPVLFKTIDNTVKHLETEISTLNFSADEIKTAKEQLETTEDQAKASITEKIETYIQMLKAKQDELHDKLPKLISEELDKLTNEQEKLQTGIDERNDFLNKAHNLLNEWDNSDVQEMEQLSKECAKYDTKYTGYKPQSLKVVFKDVMDSEIRNTISKFGSLKLEGPTPPSTPATPPAKKVKVQGSARKGSEREVKEVKEQNNKDKDKDSVSIKGGSQASDMANMY